MAQTDPSDVFDEVSEIDSKGLFKPKVVSMVVTNSEESGPNVMTAAWYMLAGYNPFRYLLSVSHNDYTHEIIEENPEFVLAAPSTEMIDALTLSGMVSGRELDKLDHLDLETIPGSEVDVPLLKDAVGNVECSVVDSFEFENHTYYFGNVEKAYVAADGFDGRLLSLDEDILAYMGSDRDEDGEKYRYYAEQSADDIRRFPDGDAISTLPDHLRQKYQD